MVLDTRLSAVRKSPAMNLDPAEAALFYATWLPLLQWVNDQKRVLPGVVVRPGGGNDPQQMVQLRDALWADEALLDGFVAKNPAALSPQALALAASWKRRRAGTYVVLRELAKYAVVIDDSPPCRVYAALGITHPISALLPWLPCMVKGVLLPFGERIIFDGLLTTYRLQMGPGIRKRLNDIYRKEKGRIITRLDEPKAPPSMNAVDLVLPDAAKAPAAKAKPAAKKKPAVDKPLVNPGRCEGCGEEFSKRTIARHLAGCEALAATSKRGQPASVFRVVAESPGAPMYWLYLDVPASATLASVDKLLRDVWLECCGHLSAFTIGGVSFASSPSRDPFLGPPERSMRTKVEAVADLPWRYEYDFGSTTELRLRVVGQHEGRGGPARLVARNLPPVWPCHACGAPAKELCAQCNQDGEAFLCAACAKRHECGEDYLLPVVNSPRMGVCAYAG
jgi:hypothetical protein